MEDEINHEERLVWENNKMAENTETSEGLTQTLRVQDEKKDIKTLPPDMTGTVVDRVLFSVVPQEGVLAEDTKPSETCESGPHVVKEEDAGIGNLKNEAINETEGAGSYVGGEHLPKDGTMTAENEENQIRLPDPCMPDGERSSPHEEVNYEYKVALKELQEESDDLTKQNVQLQTKIAEYLSRKADNNKRSKDVSDQEQYQTYMDLMENLKVQHQRSLDLHQHRMEELCQQSQEKLKQVEHEIRSFAVLKNEAAVKALTGKVGRQATLEKVEQLLADEQKKEDELACVRLNNIKLKNKVCKLEAALHSQQQLADGLLLMDFEQLKTENQTFKEKFKERGEELQRLKNKIACSVQVHNNI